MGSQPYGAGAARESKNPVLHSFVSSFKIRCFSGVGFMMGHVPLAPVVVRWRASESPWKVSWGGGCRHCRDAGLRWR